MRHNQSHYSTIDVDVSGLVMKGDRPLRNEVKQLVVALDAVFWVNPFTNEMYVYVCW